MEQFQISSYPKKQIIQFIVSVLELLFYIALILLFKFYFHRLKFIKEKIFTFILVHSLTSLLSLFIKNPIQNILFNYLGQIIQFYLLLFFIDKCLISSKLNIDKSKVEINYKFYIILIYMICTFPFNKSLGIFEKSFFDQNAIVMILCILFFEEFREKMQILIGYLNERKSISINSDMPHEIAFYYYNIFNLIYNYFYTSFLLFLLNLGAKMLENFVSYKITFQFIAYFLNLSAIYILVIGSILFFYCLNRNEFQKSIKDKKEENLEEGQNFRVIDVEINDDSDDFDENKDLSSSTSNKKRKRKNKSNNKEINQKDKVKKKYKKYEEDKVNEDDKIKEEVKNNEEDKIKQEGKIHEEDKIKLNE